ncbi:MAG: hypothetical protein NVS1B4_05540 [Gemmatimonadaceae bacterium]
MVVALATTAWLVGAAPVGAQEAPWREDRGRFTAVAYDRDAELGRSLLTAATANDTFPGLPRPKQHVLIAIAPDHARFREWVGVDAPEWGAAIAYPGSRRIVMQGRGAGGRVGDPVIVLRHELAHLALHEAMGDLPPRWFDEGYAGYAAGEWGRDEILATNLALVWRGVPSLDSLDELFAGRAPVAEAAYALAFRAVAELAAIDRQRGLTVLFAEWRESRSLDRAVRLAYGLTLAGFDERWRRRTRTHYGAIAAVADFALLGTVVALMVGPLWYARRRRDRERMRALVAADRLEAQRAEALSQLDLREDGSRGAEVSPRPTHDPAGEEPA